MSQSAATTGVFHYLYPDDVDRSDTLAERNRLAAAAAVEPILQRWRHRCTHGLIDSQGKIRNVFTRAADGSENTVSRVIRELNQVPEAVTELQSALEARLALNLLGPHRVETPVHNARLLQDTSLDGNGFQLVRHESGVFDWDDDAQVEGVYRDELAQLVRRMTGATHAFSSNHLRRQSEPDTGGDGPLARLMAQSRGPAHAAHNDFTESYGEGITRTIASGGIPHTQTFGITHRMLEAGVSAEQVRASRMLVVNTWRSVGEQPLQRFPLALVDRRSVPPSSLRPTLIGKLPSGQPRGGIDIFNAHYDPAHRWYYYPGMTRDEVLLWKGYDSAESPARPTLHSAFEDPNTPAGAPERNSIEVRVLCLLPREPCNCQRPNCNS